MKKYFFAICTILRDYGVKNGYKIRKILSGPRLEPPNHQTVQLRLQSIPNGCNPVPDQFINHLC